jgi:hypothetical protein
MKGNTTMQKEKRQTLNADKRKVIAEIFQQHFEDNSKFKKTLDEAKETYNDLREQAKVEINSLVRLHQPQEDVDTIRAMNNKYGDSGGQLYHDNCFYVQSDTPRIEENFNGQPQEYFDDTHVKFGDLDKDFYTAYYRDEMKAKGIDADYDVRLGDDYGKRNPTYYNSESAVNNYLGFGTRNDVSGKSFVKDTWDNDFKLWVIGTSYCHQRKFKASHETYLWFKSFEVAKENVILAHKNLFDHVDKKMQKLKLGLKSYRYFDQAKELADKLGIALNESVLNESSSMALSIYSPTNLADLLTDEVEQTKEEKIAIAKQLLQQQVNSLN